MTSEVDRQTFQWMGMGVVVLLLAIACPWLLGWTWVADDLGAYHLPIRDFYARCLKSGQRFDWMPSLFGGYYLTGEGQCGSYHPWHWLLYRFFPLRIAFGAEILANYPLMLVGSYFWLRQHVVLRSSALFGGIVFTFGSFNFLHFVHPNSIAVTAHLPWLLYLIARLSLSDRAPAWIVAAIPMLTASQILCGYPQYVWLSVLAEGVYAVCMFRTRVAFFYWLGWLKAIGLLLGAVQILPTWDMLQFSERANENQEFYLAYSFSPLLLIQLVSPFCARQSHELGFYIGALPLLTVLAMFLHSDLNPKSRRVMAICAIGAFLAFVLAMGSYGGLFQLTRYLPIVGSFRVPARYLMLVQLSIAPVIGLAFERLVVAADGKSRQRLPFVLITLTMASTLISVLAIFFRADDTDPPRTLLILLSPVLFVACSWLLLVLPRQAHLIAPLLGIVSICDLALHGLTRDPHINVRRPSDIVSRPPPPDRPRDRIVVEPQATGLVRNRFHGNSFTLLGWSQADGYAGLMPSSQLFGEGISVNGLRAANVRWILESCVPGDFEGLLPEKSNWREVPRPCARFRLVGQVVVGANVRELIQQFDPECTAIVAGPIGELPPATTLGQVTPQVEEPGRLRLAVECGSDQFLIITERYHHGWLATLDGNPLSIQRANGDFMGCVVPAGRHDVALEFRPSSLAHGKLLSLLGAILYTSTVAVAIIRSRSSRSDPPAVAL